ncbi:methionyl-tRNA formyltransferase [Mycoplasmopsis lipofaciens]|uniref:methionyl-tRNA formyltransferase n=1 Tax=Mycoplasmopsis lipofaciens TaxID=114884 RepID=UPI00047F5DDF|nr:methionyl-tRNA formyltransferase [Mycoplasmopsis lipofaciens]
MTKIILAGTPEFSVPIFEKIINNFEVLAIISQPDRPSIRGRKTIHTPVKLLADKYNIPCFQPEKINDIYHQLQAMDFDYLITCAFGQYIPTKILDLAKKYNLNVHGSLLPKYRGAAPIQYSLLNNDNETGISLMEMVKEMDAGDIFIQESIKIEKRDTSSSLFNKLSHLATDNIVKWIKDIESNKVKPIKQNENLVIYSPKLNKNDGEINANLSCQRAINIIRAFADNPGAYTYINNKRVKLFYGTKEKIKNSLELKMKDGILYITDYQFESKKRITLF